MIWSRLCHPNVLPLLGAATINTRLVMVSAWMVHGTVNEFVKAHPDADRLGLVSFFFFFFKIITSQLSDSCLTSIVDGYC